MVDLAPSILSSNFAHLQEDLDQLRDTGVNYLHLDIMDGAFVPNISFGFKVISDIREANPYIFDTHLMVEEPIRYLKACKKAGADLVTVHYEACQDLGETLKAIKDLDMQTGLSLKPGTDREMALPYLDKIDLVLVMSVEPGFGGQKFMEGSLSKIKNFRSYIDQNSLPVKIEVDGGIKTTNVTQVLETGADIIVSGSDIFGKDIKSQVKAYQDLFKAY